MDAASAPGANPTLADVRFEQYVDEETQMGMLMDLIDTELSEPYSIFTYRYFINSWPQLCFLAHLDGKCIGVVVCKLDQHRESFRGYVGMLVVDKPYRKLKLGSALVSRALEVMQAEGADECVLEVESTNQGALRLYQNLGFIRDKRLAKYYLSGNDAYRMKLLFPLPPQPPLEE
uniref:N-acetyltransferase domain-containing protein n=1 Tax=Mantoniella antarctica TaxID=81844 RepID=A0A7S0S692_9CHLO|mmetsp:Transcript_10768/g.26372  ORF Transcript_10768/g.26372 Transcript_10768/m.26372 type:complete len:175 (+) Transcript_10768:197-721(+)